VKEETGNIIVLGKSNYIMGIILWLEQNLAKLLEISIMNLVGTM
jgi:hypothetical protein